VPALEYVILANHAEAINGLLYLQGAGWSMLTRQVVPGQQPPAVHFGIGVSVLVPWEEADRRHEFAVWIEPEGGGSPVFSVDGGFQAGRAPGARPGSDQRTVLAIQITLGSVRADSYRLVARVGVGETANSASASFDVRDQAAVGLDRPATGGRSKERGGIRRS
jgi:hypothetical protein